VEAICPAILPDFEPVNQMVIIGIKRYEWTLRADGQGKKEKAKKVNVVTHVLY
jgi:hypothetical protein